MLVRYLCYQPDMSGFPKGFSGVQHERFANSYQPDMSGFPKGGENVNKYTELSYQPDMSGFPKGDFLGEKRERDKLPTRHVRIP